jgi:MFS family permease
MWPAGVATWAPRRGARRGFGTCADFSDLEIGPDGYLYLLSDESSTIARLDGLPAGGGTRWAMIIPAAIGLFITPLYLFVDSYPLLAGAFIAQGAFLGAIYGQNPSYLSERFPTETASGFCYHQGAIWAGFTGPLLALFAATQPLGFAVPMLVSTVGAALVFVVTLLVSPDDLDPVVLDLQLRGRSFAELRASVPIPRLARH